MLGDAASWPCNLTTLVPPTDTMHMRRLHTAMGVPGWLLDPFRLDNSDSGGSDSDSGSTDPDSASDSAASAESASEVLYLSGESLGSPARVRGDEDEAEPRRRRRGAPGPAAHPSLSPEDYRDIPAR